MPTTFLQRTSSYRSAIEQLYNPSFSSKADSLASIYAAVCDSLPKTSCSYIDMKKGIYAADHFIPSTKYFVYSSQMTPKLSSESSIVSDDKSKTAPITYAEHTGTPREQNQTSFLSRIIAGLLPKGFRTSIAPSEISTAPTTPVIRVINPTEREEAYIFTKVELASKMMHVYVYPSEKTQATNPVEETQATNPVEENVEEDVDLITTALLLQPILNATVTASSGSTIAPAIQTGSFFEDMRGNASRIGNRLLNGIHTLGAGLRDLFPRTSRVIHNSSMRNSTSSSQASEPESERLSSLSIGDNDSYQQLNDFSECAASMRGDLLPLNLITATDSSDNISLATSENSSEHRTDDAETSSFQSLDLRGTERSNRKTEEPSTSKKSAQQDSALSTITTNAPAATSDLLDGADELLQSTEVVLRRSRQFIEELNIAADALPDNSNSASETESISSFNSEQYEATIAAAHQTRLENEKSLEELESFLSDSQKKYDTLSPQRSEKQASAPSTPKSQLSSTPLSVKAPAVKQLTKEKIKIRWEDHLEDGLKSMPAPARKKLAQEYITSGQIQQLADLGIKIDDKKFELGLFKMLLSVELLSDELLRNERLLMNAGWKKMSSGDWMHDADQLILNADAKTIMKFL